MNITKKLLVKSMSLVISLSVLMTMYSTATYATIDGWVQESKVWEVTRVITKAEAAKHKYWKKGYYKAYGKGYITAKRKHYANVHLCTVDGGSVCARSGRKWGRGRVYAETDWATGVSTIVPELYYANIYYGD